MNHKFLKIFFVLSLFLLPMLSYAANLSIEPNNKTYEVGDRVMVRINVSADQSINAISGSIVFPKDKLSVENISKSGSILDFWVAEPSFSNLEGSLRFEGVSLSGFTGNVGNVLLIYFKALAEGPVSIKFDSGQVLANDGNGTDATGSLNQGSLTIVPKKIVEPKTEPEKVKELVPEPSPQPTYLLVPKIKLGKKGGVLTIEGQSDYSRSDVLLHFVSVDGSKVFISGFTGARGEFSILVPESLRDGSYSVSAIIILDNGDHSEPSNIVEVRIGDFWSLANMLAFVVFVLLLLSIYLWRKKSFYNQRTKISHDKIEKAEKVLKESIEVVKDDIRDYEANFKSVARSKISNHDSDIDLIKADLKKAENKIEEEIENLNS